MQEIHYQPFSQLVQQYFQENLDDVPNQRMVAVQINLVQKAFEIHEKLIESMQVDIQQDRLIISERTKPFKIEQKGLNKDPVKLAEQTARRLYEIKCKKDQMEKQLMQIELQQEKVRHLQEREKQNSNHKLNPNNIRSYKSEMSQQDGQKLKGLRMAYRKFQKDLQLKTKQYEQNARKLKHQQRQLQQKQLQQKCEQRKVQIQRSLELIAKRQQQRERRQQKDRALMEQIKGKKKAFEQMQKKWKAVQEEEQKRRQQLVEQRKKMQSMDYESLKQHKKRYFELIGKQKQDRDRRMAQINKVFGANSRESNLFQSRLLNVVLDQETKKKAQQDDKKRAARAFTQKKLEYAEIVRHNYKPKVDLKKAEQAINDSKKQEKQNARSYSSLQIIQKVSKNVSHVKVSNTVFYVEKTPFKYKDYLKQMGRTTKSGSYPPEIVEINKLIKDPSKSQYQKFQKAKMIAERLDVKKNRNIDSMVGNINVKLQILKEITE